MKIRMEFSYVIESKRGRGQVARSDRTTLVTDVEIAEFRDAPVVTAFSIREDAVLPSVRAPHDVRHTIFHAEHVWMALANQSGPDGVPTARSIAERLYSHHIGDERAIVVSSDSQGRATTDEIMEAVKRHVAELAIFSDGRVYQAGVFPVYEIKGGRPSDVSIMPSTVKQIERAAYFPYNDTAGALLEFGQRGGAEGFPTIIPRDAATVPESAETWMLAVAARRLINHLTEGMAPEIVSRWLTRVGGSKLVDAVNEVYRVTAGEEVDLDIIMRAAAALQEIVRERLVLVDTDEAKDLTVMLEQRIAAGQRLLADRPPIGMASP